jgi:hypothetical protein
MKELELNWEEFISKHEENEIIPWVDLNKGHALMSSKLAPLSWQITIKFLLFIAIIALPTAIVLFFYVKFWIPILMIFLSLQIIRAIRQEAAKAVIQTSLMNEDFYFHSIYSRTMIIYSK